jgi:hypothetical protein
MTYRGRWLALGIAAALTLPSHADDKLAGIACRSVHLGYPASPGVAFTIEVTAHKSAEGTYFMACGWNHGYFGMQEQGGGKKVVLFSVWDPGKGDDPNAVNPEDRVKLLHHDPKVRVGRFGGEGTGGQSFFDYDWKIGTPYRFLVTSAPDGERTAYSGYFYVPEDKAWKHLVTFSTITKDHSLRGYYSFIEDFKRDRVSTTKPRVATFGNGWVIPAAGGCEALTKARFSADSNPATNINALSSENVFTLATGGDTRNTGAKLGDTLSLPDQNRTPPTDLPDALRFMPEM